MPRSSRPDHRDLNSPILLKKALAAQTKVYTYSDSSAAAFGARVRNSRPDISQSLRGIGIASGAFFTQSQQSHVE